MTKVRRDLRTVEQWLLAGYDVPDKSKFEDTTPDGELLFSKLNVFSLDSLEKHHVSYLHKTPLKS